MKMTKEVMRYKLNELRMMLNDGEHGEEQGILVDIIKELDKAESENKRDLVSREAYEQIMWERDVAIQQLQDLGYGLGEKPREGE